MEEIRSLNEHSPLTVQWVDRTSSKNTAAKRTDSRINPQPSSTIKVLNALSISMRKKKKISLLSPRNVPIIQRDVVTKTQKFLQKRLLFQHTI